MVVVSLDEKGSMLSFHPLKIVLLEAWNHLGSGPKTAGLTLSEPYGTVPIVSTVTKRFEKHSGRTPLA